jgi:hypothetical protein
LLALNSLALYVIDLTHSATPFFCIENCCFFAEALVSWEHRRLYVALVESELSLFVIPKFECSGCIEPCIDLFLLY